MFNSPIYILIFQRSDFPHRFLNTVRSSELTQEFIPDVSLLAILSGFTLSKSLP